MAAGAALTPMRIALRAAGGPGARAARILLAERDLARLGMVGFSLTNPDDRRAVVTDDLGGYDVFVSDDVDHPLEDARRALAAGTNCVLWSDLWKERGAVTDLGQDFGEADLALVVGASLGTGLATALAGHEVARTDEPLELTIGWTVPGRPLRRGEPLPFPAPVGSRWGRPADDPDLADLIPTRRFVAPVPGDWGGAVARVTGVVDDGVAQRVVGVADHVGHLEALALAAGAATAGDGSYPPGLRWAGTSEAFLERALDAGLAVATFTSEATSRERG